MPPKKRQKTSGPSNSKTSQPQTVSEVAAGRIALKDWISVIHQGRHGFPEKRKWPLGDGGSFLDLVQRCWCEEQALISDSLTLVTKLGIMDSSSTEEDFMDKFLTMEDLVGNHNQSSWLCTYIRHQMHSSFCKITFLWRKHRMKQAGLFFQKEALCKACQIKSVKSEILAAFVSHMSDSFKPQQLVHGQDFPPAPGRFFTTSILQWSFANQSFWRLPDMNTVFDIAKSVALVGWRDEPWIPWAAGFVCKKTGKGLNKLLLDSWATANLR